MAIRYSKLTVEETGDFNKMVTDEYNGNFYRPAFELFDSNLEICALVEESSLFTKPLTVGVYYKGKMVDILPGVVFFAKFGKINVRLLSLRDIDIINKNLRRNDDKSFSIYL